MAESVGWATLQIVPVTRDVADTIRRTLDGEMRQLGDYLGRQLGDEMGDEAGEQLEDGIEDGARRANVEGAGNTLGGRLGGAMRTALVAALAYVSFESVIGGARALINMASEMEQSIGAVSAVFKDQQGIVTKWAHEAHAAMGLSHTEYRNFAVLLGSQLKNAGFAMDEVAPKTNELIQLGADLSAMFGGTAAEAVEAISSALKGERDPIEAYGITLSQAAIDAEAAALGFEKVGGSLSMDANAAATMSLLMKQSGDAAGAFAREADTAAGAAARNAAAWKNFGAEMGNVFLENTKEVHQWLYALVTGPLAMLPERVGEAGDRFRQMVDVIQNGIVEAEAVDLINPAQLGVLEWVHLRLQEIADVFAPLGQAFTDGWHAGADGARVAFESMSPIGAILQLIVDVLREAGPELQTAFGQIGEALGGLAASVAPIMSSLVEGIVAVLVPILPGLVALIGELVGAFTDTYVALAPLSQELVNQLAPVLGETLPEVIDPIIEAVKLFSTHLAEWLPVILPIAMDALPYLVYALEWALKVAVGFFQIQMGMALAFSVAVSGALQAVSLALQGDFVGAWEVANRSQAQSIGYMEQAWEGGVLAVEATTDYHNKSMATKMEQMRRDTVDKTGQTMDGMNWKASGGMRTFGSTVDDGTRRAGDSVGNHRGKFASMGEALMTGLASGIRSMAGAVLRALGDVVGSAIANAKRRLGINSPSRVFRAFGQGIGEGLSLGILDNAYMVRTAIGELTPTDPIEMPPLHPVALSGLDASGAAPAGDRGGVHVTQNVEVRTDRTDPAVLGEALAARTVAELGGRLRRV